MALDLYFLMHSYGSTYMTKDKRKRKIYAGYYIHDYGVLKH